MEKTRSIGDVVFTMGVGAAMIHNSIRVTQAFYDYSKEVAPGLQEYVGTLGKTAIEYGMPTFGFVATVFLGAIAIKATDDYMANKRYKEDFSRSNLEKCLNSS